MRRRCDREAAELGFAVWAEEVELDWPMSRAVTFVRGYLERGGA
jgi:hypothetical protein